MRAAPLALFSFLLLAGCGGGGKGGGNASKGNRTSCATNLARLYTSLNAYAGDNDDILPAVDWSDAVTPYLPVSGASLRCPAVEAGGGGYALNTVLVGAAINFVPNPDEVPLFFDVAELAPNSVGTYPSSGVRRHGGANVVYLSGRGEPPAVGEEPEPVSVRESCRANLKKVGTALVLYAADNDDRLPIADWNDSVQPYVFPNVDVFRCPAVAVGSYGYAFNSSLFGIDMATIDSPATTPSAFDSSILTRNAVSAPGASNAGRHGGDVTAFVDGHVGP